MVEGEAATSLLTGFNAPLGTLSAKTAAAAALGLIESAESEEIEIIRRIRNDFAHSWNGVSFDKGRVRDLADNLPWRGPAEYEPGATARSRFDFAIALLLVDLMWRTRLVRGDRLRTRSWPNKARI